MKRKILAIIMIMALCLTFCACGGGGSTATIIDNDGNTVQMTAQELIDISKENESKFKKQFELADITVEGKVEKVEESKIDFSIRYVDVIHLYLEGGWQIDLLKDKHEEVIDLSKGDSVKVSSKISRLATFNVTYITLDDFSVSQKELQDNTTITLQ